MSNILKRTIFYEHWPNEGGTIRFADWAISIHSNLGMVFEPFIPYLIGNTNSRPDYDWNEDCNRIDEMKEIDIGYGARMFGDGAIQLHGGRMYPRKGK